MLNFGLAADRGVFRGVAKGAAAPAPPPKEYKKG